MTVSKYPSEAEFEAFEFDKYRIPRSKSVRWYCIACSGGNEAEVAKCPVKKCVLYPYRRSKPDAVPMVTCEYARVEAKKRIPQIKHDNAKTEGDY